MSLIPHVNNSVLKKMTKPKWLVTCTLLLTTPERPFWNVKFCGVVCPMVSHPNCSWRKCLTCTV